MSHLNGVEFRYRWLPFLLNPNTPKEGMTIQDYMRQKGYHPDHYPQVHKRLIKMGRDSGIEFNAKGKGNGNMVVNTLDSLRLIDFAQATLPTDQANKLVEAVVFAHHVHGKDISDHVQLSKIGAKFGLQQDAVQKFIEDPTAFAPQPGTPEALEAIAGGPAVPVLTCDGENAGESPNGECKPDADVLVATTTTHEQSLATDDTFKKVGDKHSVLLRDLQAKRSGIHAVPHIELWRDFELRDGDVGVDCRVNDGGATRATRYWIGKKGSSITGKKEAPIVIEGANPVESFYAAFLELLRVLR